jgi:hypothetical protein
VHYVLYCNCQPYKLLCRNIDITGAEMAVRAADKTEREINREKPWACRVSRRYHHYYWPQALPIMTRRLDR